MPDTESTKLSRTIDDFCSKMNRARDYGDAVASIRIIGEFSAGKTMLVRTLLEGLVDPCLLPVSDHGRETFLPFEVTYGPRTRLSVVDRRSDRNTNPVEVAELAAFPHRREQQDKYTLGVHRMRLEVPALESQLILPQGTDYYENPAPLRFSLVDMPGWNSGESQLEEDPHADLLGDWNLAVVYVASAVRVDLALNQDFLERFCSAAFSDTPATLYYLITHCKSQDRDRIISRERPRVREMLDRVLMQMGKEPDDVKLVIETVDFWSLSVEEKEQFKELFWKGVNRPETVNRDVWGGLISQWPTEWEIGQCLAEAGSALERARILLSKVRQDGKYLNPLNKTKLLNLSPPERENKIMKAWEEQLGDSTSTHIIVPTGITIHDDHPLNTWWSDFFLPGLRDVLNPLEALLHQAEQVMRHIPEYVDIEDFLDSNLNGLFKQATQSLNSSFAILCASLTGLSRYSEPEAVATVLALSIMDARYRDYVNEVASVG